MTFNYISLSQSFPSNEIMLFVGLWMELEIIMLSEGSQIQKEKGHMFSLICGRQIQTQVQALSYTCIYDMGLLEETREGGEKENDTVNDLEIYHTCKGTRHSETH
jgi:hypothetical protein